MFLVCHVISCKQMFKRLCEFMGVSLYIQSPPCHVWWRLIKSKWRYKVFNMSRDLTKPRDCGIKLLYEWEPFMVCQHLAKFDGHRHCTSRNMFLVCHMIK